MFTDWPGFELEWFGSEFWWTVVIVAIVVVATVLFWRWLDHHTRDGWGI